MRAGSIFSGAGGLDMAAMQAIPGLEVVWHVENDPDAAAVLRHRWPDVSNYGDVTTVDWTRVEPVDVLIGGFPCQDISSAGKRAGLADGTRSGLWSHMRDAIAVLRPAEVFIENVRGLLSAYAARDMESGPDALGDNGNRPILRAAGAICGDLATLGYDAQWTTLRASGLGFCHRRERVFIHAHPADTSRDGRPGQSDSPCVSAARPSGQRDSSGDGGVDTVSDTHRDAVRTQPQPQPRGGRPAITGRPASDAVSVALLPTPSVADDTGGHASSSGVRSDELLLPGVARAYADGTLPTLPTPTARLGSSRGTSHPDDRKARSKFRSGELDEIAVHVIPERWGRYAAAIARQEALCGAAPTPVEAGPRGGKRLAAPFPEWMMGWPSGWVTDPAIGLSRNAQLRLIGNGVVPTQGAAAFRYLLGLKAVA